MCRMIASAGGIRLRWSGTVRLVRHGSAGQIRLGWSGTAPLAGAGLSRSLVDAQAEFGNYAHQVVENVRLLAFE